MASLRKNTLYYACGSGVVATISIVSLPLTTLILDPVHYGQFALVSAIATAVHGTFSSATSYFINGHYMQTKIGQRPHVVASVLAAAFLTSVVGAALAFLLLQIVPEMVSGFLLPTVLYAAFALSLIPLSLWTSVSQMMVLDEQAWLFAAGMNIGPLVGATVTIVLINTTTMRTESLVLGAIAGNILTGLFCLPWIVRRTELKISREVIHRILRLVPTAFSGNTLEAIQPSLERIILASVVNLDILGLYVHSQTYSQTIFKLIKSVVLSTFPISLREAMETPQTFSRTVRIWVSTYYILGVITLGFIFFGEFLISALTHGKFTEAHPFASVLLIIVNVQNLGRQANALLYSQARSQTIASINFVSSAVALALLFVLIPFFGVYGAIGAIAARVIINRIGFMIFTWPIGIKEEMLPLGGVMMSMMALALYELLRPTFVGAALFFLAFLVLWSLSAKRGAISALDIALSCKQRLK